MSTPPKTPSPRTLAREAAGLVLAAVGPLVVLLALGAVHPVLATTTIAIGAFAVFRFLTPSATRRARHVALSVTGTTAVAAVGSTLVYFPPLGWVEIGAALTASGVWLTSEAA
ncbi:hypothetical protein ACWD4V_00915 [Streptomyces tsukubensis]